jgi:PKHD-type hydroxylase
MLLRIPQVLSPEALKRCRQIVDGGPWADGRSTAGTQSQKVKNNLQLPEGCEAAREAGRLVRSGLAGSALFFSAALPRRVFPPLFNRYAGAANAFGAHIDNAVRVAADTGESLRTDLSATLFLSDPAEYEGGELVIEEAHGEQRIKLPAGDMILYPASSVHRVQPVTKGARIASFFWVESMVREPDRRRLLFDFDMAIVALRASAGDTQALVRLTGCYHNLLRMWAVP